MQIDTVQRWTGVTSVLLQADKSTCTASWRDIDSMGWGDNRPAIYALIEKGSVLLTEEDGFFACSSSASLNRIGPWGAFSRVAAADLLDAAIRHDGDEINTFLDVPVHNISAGELLRLKGFSVSGTTLLMYRGQQPDYRAEHVYALASLGSFG